MTSHTDAGALLKLADDLEWLALASNKDFALHNGRGKMTKASIAIRQAASQGSAGGRRFEVRSEDTIPLADHDEIGRKVIGQPWAIQAAIVTICAHCTVLVDKHPTGDVAALAGCISDQCRELANALSGAAAQSPDQIEIIRLSGLLAEAQKIIAEYKASTIATARIRE